MQTGQDGDTSLMRAVSRGRLAVVAYLCAQGANVNAQNNVSMG